MPCAPPLLGYVDSIGRRECTRSGGWLAFGGDGATQHAVHEAWQALAAEQLGQLDRLVDRYFDWNDTMLEAALVQSQPQHRPIDGGHLPQRPGGGALLDHPVDLLAL